MKLAVSQGPGVSTAVRLVTVMRSTLLYVTLLLANVAVMKDGTVSKPTAIFTENIINILVCCGTFIKEQQRKVANCKFWGSVFKPQ